MDLIGTLSQTKRLLQFVFVQWITIWYLLRYIISACFQSNNANNTPRTEWNDRCQLREVTTRKDQHGCWSILGTLKGLLWFYDRVQGIDCKQL